MRIDAKTTKLVLDMIKTFDDLGADGMARIDARLWYAHYLRKAKRLGFKVPKKT